LLVDVADVVIGVAVDVAVGSSGTLEVPRRVKKAIFSLK